MRVVEFLNTVEKQVGPGKEIHVVSGFRSPEHNALLIRQGLGAAKRSLHMAGKAIDFRIPGVHPAQIRKAALKVKFGGVGYYPEKGFVHLDSGPFRVW